jgi:hypothetical protein
MTGASTASDKDMGRILVTQPTWPRSTVLMTPKEKKLNEFVVAVIGFLSTMGAALLRLFSKTSPPSEYLKDDTGSRDQAGGQPLFCSLFLLFFLI